jgi:hypothetical protein
MCCQVRFLCGCGDRKHGRRRCCSRSCRGGLQDATCSWHAWNNIEESRSFVRSTGDTLYPAHSRCCSMPTCTLEHSMLKICYV